MAPDRRGGILRHHRELRRAATLRSGATPERAVLWRRTALNDDATAGSRPNRAASARHSVARGETLVERLMPGLERRLKAELRGEVRFDRFTRGRYATDAFALPDDAARRRRCRGPIADAERVLAIARAERVSVLAAAAGTSQAGQTVNSSLVIDCSKHLDKIVELDVAGRRCVVEPGIVLDELNRQLPPARPVVPGRRLDRRRAPPSAEWWATTPAAPARCATATRARTCCRSTRSWPTAQGAFRSGGARPLRSPRGLAAGPDRGSLAARSGGARRRKSRRASQGPAPRRRLQPRCADAGPERAQSRPHPRRLRGHARLLDRDRAEAVTAAQAARRRRLPFRPLPRGDGCGAVHRQARPDRGRARRPHHDRAGARHRHVPPDARINSCAASPRRSCSSSSARTTTTRTCAACGGSTS